MSCFSGHLEKVLAIRFDQYHNKDRHDGRKTDKFHDMTTPKDANYLKMLKSLTSQNHLNFDAVRHCN